MDLKAKKIPFIENKEDNSTFNQQSFSQYNKLSSSVKAKINSKSYDFQK